MSVYTWNSEGLRNSQTFGTGSVQKRQFTMFSWLFGGRLGAGEPTKVRNLTALGFGRMG